MREANPFFVLVLKEAQKEMSMFYGCYAKPSRIVQKDKEGYLFICDKDGKEIDSLKCWQHEHRVCRDTCAMFSEYDEPKYEYFTCGGLPIGKKRGGAEDGERHAKQKEYEERIAALAAEEKQEKKVQRKNARLASKKASK